MGLVALEDMPHGLIRLGSVTRGHAADARDQVGLVEDAGRVQGAVESLIVTVAERAGLGVGMGAGDVEDVVGVLGDGPGGGGVPSPQLIVAVKSEGMALGKWS